MGEKVNTCFYQKTMEMVARQIGYYNGIDSTSISVEKAQEIYESCLYTLQILWQQNLVKEPQVLDTSLELMLEEGRLVLKDKVQRARQGWNQLALKGPRYGNDFYNDTVREVGAFFDRYDIFYGAHLIPCGIDYPLINPVSEELKGISYIELYLNRLCLENHFLGLYQEKSIISILKNTVGDVRKSYYNMAEEVFMTSLSRWITGDVREEASDSSLVGCQQEAIKVLRNKTCQERWMLLSKGCDIICRDAEFGGMKLRNYFGRLIDDFYIRL